MTVKFLNGRNQFALATAGEEGLVSKIPFGLYGNFYDSEGGINLPSIQKRCQRTGRAGSFLLGREAGFISGTPGLNRVLKGNCHSVRIA